MLYWAYSVSFVCMEICIGCIGFVCERKLKKQSQKKLISRPPFKFLVAKPKKIAKKIILGGVLRKNAGFANFKSLDDMHVPQAIDQP